MSIEVPHEGADTSYESMSFAEQFEWLRNNTQDSQCKERLRVFINSIKHINDNNSVEWRQWIQEITISRLTIGAISTAVAKDTQKELGNLNFNLEISYY